MIDEKDLRHKIELFRYAHIKRMDGMLNEASVKSIEYTLNHVELFIQDLEKQCESEVDT